MKKVAIVGYAHPSKDRAPFDDYQYQIWGMNEYYYRIPRRTMWFEMHYTDVKEIENIRYREWLQTTLIPVVMHKKNKDIPGSMKYPIGAISKEFDPYFNCTVDYMIALAIWMGFQVIELYGILCLKEYEFEKKGIAYWLGVCRGKGIKFSVPDEADILKPVYYGRKEVSLVS